MYYMYFVTEAAYRMGALFTISESTSTLYELNSVVYRLLNIEVCGQDVYYTNTKSKTTRVKDEPNRYSLCPSMNDVLVLY